VNYNYLLWNLPRTRSGALLPGGGIVEAVLVQGQPISLCRVPRVTVPACDRRGERNGSVVFGSGGVHIRGHRKPIFGWVLLGYPYRGVTRRTTTEG